MQTRRTGVFEEAEVLGFRARVFEPFPLPPDPPLRVGAELRNALDAALLSLGRLDSITTLLPDRSLFLYMYVRREAVLSSQIEGTKSTLSDLLLFELDETPGAPINDVVEVSNYIAALDHGLKSIRSGGAITSSLIRQLHGILLSKGRGSEKRPGHFRTEPTWVNGSRPDRAEYVPPNNRDVPQCMKALERFLNAPAGDPPTVIKAALAHVQFETIHPFLDGNGRVGRLLIPLLMCSESVLQEPLLYLSLYFKVHREEYYRLLQRVRTHGEWEEWLEFFAEGIRSTAESAVSTAQRISKQFEVDREALRGEGRVASNLLLVHEVLQAKPIVSVKRVVEMTGLSQPTVGKAMQILCDKRIVQETTGQQRFRLYSYSAYLQILNEGTEVEA